MLYMCESAVNAGVREVKMEAWMERKQKNPQQQHLCVLERTEMGWKQQWINRFTVASSQRL